MFLNKEKFAFAIDRISPSGCSGWYIRRDKTDNYFLLDIGGKQTAVAANLERADVENAGFGTSRCGFNIRFEPPLEAGSAVVFKDAFGEELHRYSLDNANYKPDALSARMVRLVEPFVEMDIAKVRASLMNNLIYDQYRKLFRESLANKTPDELKTELVEILADVKTTMHMLCAAYLDYTRYKEPDFLVSLPQFCPDVVKEFEIDMKGDITGSNWSEPEQGGRWTGNMARASVLLPNPGPGKYDLAIEVGAERKLGDLDKLRIYVDGKKVPFKRNGKGFPCALEAEIPVGDSPFLSLHFQYDSSERQLPPDKKNLRSVLMKSLKFNKK